MYKRFYRWFPVFVLPTLAAFTIAFLIPFGMGIWLSFHRFSTVTNARFVGLENYVRAFGDGDFRFLRVSDHAVVYERASKDERIFVAANRGEEPFKFRLDGQITDLLTGEVLCGTVSVAPDTARIFLAEPRKRRSK